MRPRICWWLCSVLVAVGMLGCRVTPNQPNQPTPVRPTPIPVQPVKPPTPKPVPGRLSVLESVFNKVQPGWTTAQVTALLGQPWRTMPQDQKGHTYWHYKVQLEAGTESVEVDGEIELNGSTVVGRVTF